MNTFKNLLSIVLSAGVLVFSSHAFAQEAPDALVKRISQEVLDIAKADKEIQGGNQRRVLDLVETKILPYVDFQRMTALAAGRYWRDATPEQQKQLVSEFRSLLVFTYSGAISQIKDQQVEFKPMRTEPTDTDVIVRSQVVQARGGEPIQLHYRMEKVASGWKIYDINVLGAWLVETYKSNFASEIGKNGIDGLIKTLVAKNKSLSAGTGKSAKS